MLFVLQLPLAILRISTASSFARRGQHIAFVQGLLTPRARRKNIEILVSETRRKFPTFGIWDEVTA